MDMQMDLITEVRIKQLIDELTADSPSEEVVLQRWNDLLTRNRQSQEHILELAREYRRTFQNSDDDQLTSEELKAIARAIRPLLTGAEKQYVIDVALAKRQQRALEG